MAPAPPNPQPNPARLADALMLARRVLPDRGFDQVMTIAYRTAV
jgi:hypothetical protein